MQKVFHQIISVGIRANYSQVQIEKTKLVNGISFVGVPVCFFYLALFALTGYNYHAVVFFVGAIIFAITLFFNKIFGLNFARIYISVFAPACFGYVNLISGIDSGFYMGFIVTTIPALLVFDKLAESIVFIFISLSLLVLSIIGTHYIMPVVKIEFAMILLVINLFTVIMATLTIVFIFKKELNESKEKTEEKQKEILDSIHYAKRIQNALLPNENYIAKNLNKLKDNKRGA
jgi:hypothetical protein